jgi:rhombotail lipoprotein
MQRSLSPALQRVDDQELEKLLNTRGSLTPALRAAIAWVDGPGGSSLPDAERIELLQSMATELRQHPFVGVTILPTQPQAPIVYGQTAEPPDLRQLRSGAARAQADVLILVETENEEYVDWNLLAVSYVGLVTPFFIPGDQLAVYTSAEACAIDVRSGVFLGCMQGYGEAERAMSLPTRRGRTFRSLSRTATEKAVHTLSAPLRDQISTHIASSALGAASRFGTRYETMVEQ